MEKTGRYDLPLIMPSQAQKHVTHNEALTLVDGLIHVAVKSFGETAPPLTAQIDDTFVVGASATGGWFGEDSNIAFNTEAGWRFAAPRQCMIALNLLTLKLVLFDAGIWKPLGDFVDIASVSKLGINTTADAVNKLAVRANAALLAALLVADGGSGDFRLTINKEAAAKTGSLLFQTGFVGRAEFGLTGDDDFRVKVSPNGASWTDAIRIDRTSGVVTLTDNSIGNATLADMPTATIKGRVGAGTGDPENLSVAQTTALLNQFSTTAKGLVPASISASAGYLKSDGSWSFPTPADGTTLAPARFYAFNDCLAVINEANWFYTVTGTGAAHSAIAFADLNSVGAIRGALGTVATNRISIASLSLASFSLGNGPARYGSRLRMASVSDATNTWSLRNGFIDSVSSESVDGVFFRYTDSVNGGRFQAVSRANNIETASDTGILAALATTYKMEIDINADATVAVFRVNGAVVSTITTNIPKGAGRELGYGLLAMRTVGVAAINAYDAEYLLADLQFTSPR
jgi:hypothetical protein